MELIVAAWKRYHIERLVNLELGRDLDHPVTEQEITRVCKLDPGIKIVYVADVGFEVSRVLYPGL